MLIATTTEPAPTNTELSTIRSDKVLWLTYYKTSDKHWNRYTQLKCAILQQTAYIQSN